MRMAASKKSKGKVNYGIEGVRGRQREREKKKKKERKKERKDIKA